MTTQKRIRLAMMALFLCSCMLFGCLLGCSSNIDLDKPLLIGEKEIFDEIDDQSSIDVEAIYQKLEYNERMLYGHYLLPDEENRLKTLANEIPMMDLSFFDRSKKEKVTSRVSSIPARVIAGPTSLGDSFTEPDSSRFLESLRPLRFDNSNNWAVLYFLDENGVLVEVVCTYSVEGKQVRFCPVQSVDLEWGDKGASLQNFVAGEDFLTYSFRIKGPTLSLSNGTSQLDLCSYLFCTPDNDEGVYAYLAPDSACFEDVDKIGILWRSLDGFVTKKDGETMFHCGIKLDPNGLATLVWYEETIDSREIRGVKQFAYIVAGVDIVSARLILADNDGVYYYTDDIETREKRQLMEDVPPEIVAVIPEEKIKEIAATKEDLFADLSAALKAQGITTTIYRTTGEIALDASVLFKGDSGELTEAGKTALKEFVSACSSVICGEKYREFIREIAIEGHTAPVKGSTYESGLPLSKERAENVLTFCLSSEMGLSDDNRTLLSEKMIAIGRSNEKPVYGDDGKINMALSRRVSFRFVVNID